MANGQFPASPGQPPAGPEGAPPAGPEAQPPQDAAPQDAQALVSQAATSLGGLSDMAAKTPGISPGAKQNIQVALKSLQAFVEEMSQPAGQGPQGPAPDAGQVPVNQGAGEVLPG